MMLTSDYLAELGRIEALEEEVRHWRAQVEAMHAELDALAIPRTIAGDDPRILSLLERFRVFFKAAIFGIPDGLMETYLKERPSLSEWLTEPLTEPKMVSVVSEDGTSAREANVTD